MADITWTAALPRPARFVLRLRAPSLRYTSLLTGQTQTLAQPGATVWGISMEWPAMTRARSAELEALFARLRGQANRLVIWNLGRPGLRGAGGGTPVVNGAGQTGATINISGLPNNVTGWALPGDFVGVGGELKMVVASVDSNGSGQAAMTVEPPVRVSPGNGSAIVTSQPTARFMASTDQVEWAYGRPNLASGHTLELIEAFA
jgi:hypothetical protein